MKNALVALFALLLVAGAGIAAMKAWPGIADDALYDLHAWFGYFSGPSRRQ
jgi:hypothetical protein